MSAKKTHDLVIKTGTYTDKEGKEKGRYENVGALLEKDDGGKFILLNRTFNPAGCLNPDGRSTVIISMFEPKAKEEGTKPVESPSDISWSQ